MTTTITHDERTLVFTDDGTNKVDVIQLLAKALFDITQEDALLLHDEYDGFIVIHTLDILDEYKNK